MHVVMFVHVCAHMFICALQWCVCVCVCMWTCGHVCMHVHVCEQVCVCSTGRPMTVQFMTAGVGAPVTGGSESIENGVGVRQRVGTRSW